MKRKNLIADIAVSGLFCALICVGAFIKIPIPNLPITMQVFFVLLSGMVLSPKTAFFASFSYMFLGLIGIPLFTGGGGLGYVFIPTFGYIIGFTVASPVMALILKKIKKNQFFIMFLIGLLGILIIYSIGVPYFALITNVYKNGGKSAMWFINTLVLPFLLKEFLSALAASLLAYKLRPIMLKIK